jgi:hypothetical protein
MEKNRFTPPEPVCSCVCFCSYMEGVDVGARGRDVSLTIEFGSLIGSKVRYSLIICCTTTTFFFSLLLDNFSQHNTFLLMNKKERGVAKKKERGAN